MKKELPYAIPITIPYANDAALTDAAIASTLYRLRHCGDEGYRVTPTDAVYYLACCYIIAIENPASHSSTDLNAPYFQVPEVKFQILRLKWGKGMTLNAEEERFFVECLINRYNERMGIIKKEIGKTIDNEKRIKTDFKSDYEQLLEQASKFEPVTLMDWFIPIHLDFKGFIHIYVRHVEETKFGTPNLKPRSYFQYDHQLIFKLLRKVLKADEENIKAHFMEVIVAVETDKKYGKLARYYRGKRGRSPIEYNGDKFALEIEDTGRIASFYQL